ncbi:nuclear body protein [Clarias magur]|uniref:Nuclear body protein n=1 Tax=Clarias magur TaxID=1594786 RepID=A0A8J4U6L8_CLAMG|nr:nuclear body protein [Clarias magur]
MHDAEQNSETSKTMWLNKVKANLQNKEYTTVREFANDINLIFSKWEALNSDNEFGIMGAKLKEMFEREFQTIFKIK